MFIGPQEKGIMSNISFRLQAVCILTGFSVVLTDGLTESSVRLFILK